MSTLSLSDTAAPVAAENHYYQFYRRPDDLFRVGIPFLHLGLENKEACFWIVSESVGILAAIQAFQREYDVTRYIENGQLLMVPAERWYMERGRFSEKKILARLKQFMREKRREGFTAFRGAGDTGWLQDRDWNRFTSYEAKIHQWIQTLRMTALCAYPIHHCSLTQAKDVVEHHHRVFLTKL